MTTKEKAILEGVMTDLELKLKTRDLFSAILKILAECGVLEAFLAAIEKFLLARKKGGGK
ncbi:MAG: hypothetical protein IJ659_00885 [Alloprevotella sp.]|nr:hypothetical protein [Alloprevotella sp.]